VDDARDLVLAAKLSALLHPVREGAAMDRYHLRWPEAEATGPVCTIIVILSAQARIQCACKSRHLLRTRRWSVEFHNEGMAPQRVVRIGKPRADGEVRHVGGNRFGSLGDRGIDFFAGQVLAECR